MGSDIDRTVIPSLNLRLKLLCLGSLVRLYLLWEPKKGGLLAVNWETPRPPPPHRSVTSQTSEMAKGGISYFLAVFKFIHSFTLKLTKLLHVLSLIFWWFSWIIQFSCTLHTPEKTTFDEISSNTKGPEYS